MTKAELQAAHDEYAKAVDEAQKCVAAGQYAQGIAHAMRAWNHVDAMMRYRARYEEATFESLPCVDIVLRYGPFMFHFDALEQLREMLKEHKSLERRTTSNLGERLSAAVALMWQAHKVWHCVEQGPGITQAQIREQLGGGAAALRKITEELTAMGLLQREKTGNCDGFRLTTCLNRPSTAKCPECGAVASGAKAAFLAQRNCPRCSRQTSFVLLHESAGHSTEE